MPSMMRFFLLLVLGQDGEVVLLGVHVVLGLRTALIGRGEGELVAVLGVVAAVAGAEVAAAVAHRPRTVVLATLGVPKMPGRQ
ncbi:hypothetical protein [Streptomyces mirabilis]